VFNGGEFPLQQNQKAILIVEDNALIRMDAVDMAIHEGFIVFEAESADHAIAILEAHFEIRLVFTDIEMPGSMDGLKLAEYVRHRWPPIKLIVTSGKVPRDKAALPEGGLFFSKPYAHAEILTAMHTLLAA
jgi:two-component system, response regulator PdtaR